MIFSIDVTYCSVFRKKLSWILEIQIKKQIEKSHEINFFFNNFHKHTPSNKKKLLILKQRNKARTKKNPKTPSTVCTFILVYTFSRLILGQFSHGCPVFRCPPVRPKCARPRYYLHNGRICRHCDRNICPHQFLKGR